MVQRRVKITQCCPASFREETTLPGFLEDEALEKAALSWRAYSSVSVVEPSLDVLFHILVAAKVKEQMQHVSGTHARHL